MAPGVLLRSMQWMTLGSLVIVAAIALVQLGGTITYDLCIAGGTAPHVCAMRSGPISMSDFGVPLTWQEVWLDVPQWLSALVLIADLVAAGVLIRPRTVHVDPVTRTLIVKQRRLFLPNTVARIELEGANVVCEQSGVLTSSVLIVERDGIRHDVSGPRLGRWRQERLVRALVATIERGV